MNRPIRETYVSGLKYEQDLEAYANHLERKIQLMDPAFQNFVAEVGKVVNSKDFKKSQKVLESVKPQHRPEFISCLLLGANIKNAARGVHVIEEISIVSVLKPSDVVDVLNRFRSLIAIIDLKD